MSYNMQIIVGNVGNDPEIRHTPAGVPVANFSVATTKRWTKDGERQEKTTWHRVACFNRLAEIVGQYVTKGTLILIQGETDNQKYQDKDTGADRYSTQVIAQTMQLLGGRPEGSSNNAGGQQQATSKPVAGTMPDAASGEFDDDIPF